MSAVQCGAEESHCFLCCLDSFSVHPLFNHPANCIRVRLDVHRLLDIIASTESERLLGVGSSPGRAENHNRRLLGGAALENCKA